MSKILVIEDDQAISEALEDTLKFHGYEVRIAPDGGEGYQAYLQIPPDLIVLDIMLPDHDGFSVCKKIRETDPHVPIIILTARRQESDKLLGFELGADDYMTKPFSIKELVARIQAVLKRTSGMERTTGPSKPVSIGKAVLDFKTCLVTRDGVEYRLSKKEHDILKLFVTHPNEVIDRNRIIDEVWGGEYFPSPRTIDNFILRLRNKIEDDPKSPKHLVTVHGIGYKLVTNLLYK